VRAVLRKLQAGREWFILRPGESATVIVVSDVDDFVEVPIHTYENQRVLCGFFGGDSCSFCESQVQLSYRIALHVYQEETGEDLVALWGWGQNTPFRVMADVYTARGVPFRGMKLHIQRSGSGRETTYAVTYLGNVPIDRQPLPREEVMRRAIAQVNSWVRRNHEHEGEEVPF
jgi:hypothetical protein